MSEQVTQQALETALLQESASIVLTAPFIGSFIDSVFQGMIAPLFITYLRTDARREERIAIIVAFAAGIVDTLVHLSAIVELGVYDYNKAFEVLLMTHWQYLYQYLPSGIVTVIVQTLYGIRLYKLQKETWHKRAVAVMLGILIPLYALASIGLILVSALAPRLDSLYDPNAAKLWEYKEKLITWILLYYSFLIVADVTVCLTTVLTINQGKKDAFEKTKSLISKLTRLSIRSMLLPTLIAFVVLVLRLCSPGMAGQWDAIGLTPLSKVTLFTCLHMLTSRESLRKNVGGISSVNVRTSMVQGSSSDKDKFRSMGLEALSFSKSRSKPFQDQLEPNARNVGTFSRLESKSEIHIVVTSPTGPSTPPSMDARRRSSGGSSDEGYQTELVYTQA